MCLSHVDNITLLKLSSEWAFEKELTTATSVCLQQAAADDYKSIALPLISAGQFGGPIKSVAKAMGRAIVDFVNSKQTNKLQVNILYFYQLFDKEVLCCIFMKLPNTNVMINNVNIIITGNHCH